MVAELENHIGCISVCRWAGRMRKFFAVMIIFIFGCGLIFAGETEVNDATDSPLPPPSKHSIGVKEMVESMGVLIGIDSQAKGVGCLDSKYIYIYYEH